jgi:hypothetical protein
MPAATRSRTVSRGSGRRGEKKGEKKQKKAIYEWKEDCPGNKGSLHLLPFLSTGQFKSFT